MWSIIETALSASRETIGVPPSGGYWHPICAFGSSPTQPAYAPDKTRTECRAPTVSVSATCVPVCTGQARQQSTASVKFLPRTSALNLSDCPGLITNADPLPSGRTTVHVLAHIGAG
jgi:hypothetical protein